MPEANSIAIVRAGILNQGWRLLFSLPCVSEGVELKRVEGFADMKGHIMLLVSDLRNGAFAAFSVLQDDSDPANTLTAAQRYLRTPVK